MRQTDELTRLEESLDHIRSAPAEVGTVELIAAQPTRGLDVGAIEFVHRRLVAVRELGVAILLVSFELEEILSLSDRILVLYEGRIVAELPPDASEEEVGIAMTGARREVAV